MKIIKQIHLRKGLYSKRREFNKVILRAVSHIVLLRCPLIHNQHYALYEHTHIYIYISMKNKAVSKAMREKAEEAFAASKNCSNEMFMLEKGLKPGSKEVEGGR